MSWMTEIADPDTLRERALRSLALPMGLANPLWLAFGAAASAGAAWWLMTRWTRPFNAEAFAALIPTPATPSARVLGTPVEQAVALLPLATELALEPAETLRPAALLAPAAEAATVIARDLPASILPEPPRAGDPEPSPAGDPEPQPFGDPEPPPAGDPEPPPFGDPVSPPASDPEPPPLNDLEPPRLSLPAEGSPGEAVAAPIAAAPLGSATPATLLGAVPAYSPVTAKRRGESPTEYKPEPVSLVAEPRAPEPSAPKPRKPRAALLADPAATETPEQAAREMIKAERLLALEVVAETEDDLTRLIGVGPRTASALMERGVTRFAHLAAWTDEQMAAFDAEMNLKGRSLRDAWRAQAERMAAEAP